MTIKLLLFFLFFNSLYSFTFGKFNEMIQYMIKAKEHYDKDGNLTLLQYDKNGWESDSVSLFFKGKLTDCGLADGGLYFDIISCIKKNGVCGKGLKICYKSELTPELVKDKKYVMRNALEQYGCEDAVKYHSLYIEIDERTETAKIVSSIDKNIYTFKLPKYIAPDDLQCFKIRVGTKDSIKTQITDIDDNQIDVKPPLPELDMSDLLANGWNQRDNNFHIFALDFIPKMNKWQQNYGDYFKSFIYQGSKEQCDLSLQFVGKKIHRCQALWIDTGMRCPGPFVVKQNETSKERAKANECVLDPNQLSQTINNPFEKVNYCNFYISETSEASKSVETRDISSSGNENEIEDYRKLQFFPYEKYSPVRRTMDYHHKIYKHKNYDSFKRGIKKKQGGSFEVSFIWKLQVGQGCIIVIQELFANCNGWNVKTGQFRFQAREYTRDDSDKECGV